MTPLPKTLPRIPGLRRLTPLQRMYERTPAADLLRRNRRAAERAQAEKPNPLLIPLWGDTIRALPPVDGRAHPDDEMDDGFYRACLLAPRVVGDDGVPMLVALRLYQAGLVEVVG